MPAAPCQGAPSLPSVPGPASPGRGPLPRNSGPPSSPERQGESPGRVSFSVVSRFCACVDCFQPLNPQASRPGLLGWGLCLELQGAPGGGSGGGGGACCPCFACQCCQEAWLKGAALCIPRGHVWPGSSSPEEAGSVWRWRRRQPGRGHVASQCCRLLGPRLAPWLSGSPT